MASARVARFARAPSRLSVSARTPHLARLPSSSPRCVPAPHRSLVSRSRPLRTHGKDQSRREASRSGSRENAGGVPQGSKSEVDKMWQEWQNSAEFSQLQQARDAELRSALNRGGSRRTESAAADLGSGQKTVLAAVLGVNMSVFAAWQYGRWDPESGVEAWMWEHFTASKRALHQNHFYTLLTNSVSHRDVGHFAFNMWFLYVVGQNLLGTVSPPAFLGLYAVSGVASTALQLYTSTGDVRSLGASGAAYAIAGAAFASSPHALYGTLLGVMPAWQLGLILLAWEAYSWRQQRAAGEIGGVGRAAHLSGFALGVGYGIALRRLGRGAAGF